MTVYVIQEVPKFNISGATRYGDIEVILPPGNMYFSTESTVKKAYDKLKDFKPGDYLLCIGDPIAIAICFAAAASMVNGKINLLKWDRQNQIYVPVKIDLLKCLGERND